VLERCAKITDAGLQAIRPLAALNRLDLGACRLITDAGLLYGICPITTLTTLSLYGCREITDAGLQALTALTALERLDLTSCREITDTGLQALQPLTALERLDLSHCSNLTPAGVQELGHHIGRVMTHNLPLLKPDGEHMRRCVCNDCMRPLMAAVAAEVNAERQGEL
jgi:hypothetical protein